MDEKISTSRQPQSSLKRRRSTKEEISVGEKRERKRKINRLSAQRKRERERVELDTLTDRFAQLSYLNKELVADNNRLKDLLEHVKLIHNFQNQKRDDSVALTRREDLKWRSQIGNGLCIAVSKAVDSVYHADVTRFDPETGSAAAPTTTSPFKHTTLFFSNILVVLRETRGIVESLVRAEKQDLPLSKQPQSADAESFRHPQVQSITFLEQQFQNDYILQMASALLGGPAECDEAVAARLNLDGSVNLDSLLRFISRGRQASSQP